MTHKYNFKSFFLPSLIFIFSFLLRLSLISKGPYHVDCLVLVKKAEIMLSTHQWGFLHGTGYPLTVLLGAFFIALGRIFSFTDSVLAVNFMSVVFSSLCILSLYYIVNELFDDVTAFLSAIFLSTMPVFLGVSVYGKSHTPSLFFLLTGILCLLKYQKSGKKYLYWLSIILLGFMGATRLQDFIFMIPAISFLIIFPLNSNLKHDMNTYLKKFPFKALIIFWVSCLFITISFHLPYVFEGNPDYMYQLQRFWNRGLTNNFKFFYLAALKVGALFTVNALSPVGFVLALLGSIFTFKRNRYLFTFLLIWFFVPFSFYGNLVTIAPRFLILAIIPLLVFESAYLRYYLTLKKRTLNFCVFGVTLIIFCANITFILPILSIRHNTALLPELAVQIGAWTESNAQIIASDEADFIDYYGKRSTVRRPRNIYDYSQEELHQFKNHIDSLLSQKIPVYITDSGLYTYDYRYQFSRFMKEHYTIKYIGKNLYESWQRGETYLRVGWDGFYRVEPFIEK